MSLQKISQSKILPSLSFWLLGLIWGSNFIYMRLATQYISPMQVVFLRVILATLPVLFYGMWQKAFSKKHLKYTHHFVVMSILATALYYYCFVTGSHLLYSGIAGALSGVAPIFTFILGAMFLDEEKVTPQKIIGLIIGMLGVVILAKPFATSITPTTWQGIGYMMVGTLSFSASFIYAKKFISPLQIAGSALTTYQLASASVILLLITDFTGMTAISQNFHVMLGVVIGLGFLGTGLAYLIYYFLIDRMGAMKASSVAYIPPIVALLIGALLAGEPIALTDFVGAMIVLLGVYLLKK